jgi:ketosteroid isomerase-like protein
MESTGAKTMSSDEATLRHLNEEYIRAFMEADVKWYVQYLAEDFVVIESDGTVLTKPEFLTQTAKGPDVATYKLDQVNVRFYGDVALVQATGLFTRKDCSTGMSRYTDIYVRMGKDWKVVSAQITRGAAPAAK